MKKFINHYFSNLLTSLNLLLNIIENILTVPSNDLISNEMRKIMSNPEDKKKVEEAVNHLKQNQEKEVTVQLSYRKITLSIQ